MSSEPDPTRPIWGPAREVTGPIPAPVEYRPEPDPWSNADTGPPTETTWIPPTSPPSPPEPGPPTGPTWLPPASSPAPPPAPAFHPPPSAAPLYQPPPVPPPAVPPARTSRTVPAVLIGVGLVVLLVGGGIAWAASRPDPGYPPTPTPTSTSTYAVPTSTVVPTQAPAPTLASPDGLVVVAATAADAPEAQTVLSLLDRHFSAINSRDYATWTTTVDARRAAGLSSGDWARAYRTTQDGSVEVSSITAAGSDRVLVTLSFTSTQDVSDAPPDLPLAQICWSSTWPVSDVSSGGRILSPQKGATMKSAC